MLNFQNIDDTLNDAVKKVFAAKSDTDYVTTDIEGLLTPENTADFQVEDKDKAKAEIHPTNDFTDKNDHTVAPNDSGFIADVIREMEASKNALINSVNTPAEQVNEQHANLHNILRSMVNNLHGLYNKHSIVASEMIEANEKESEEDDMATKSKADVKEEMISPLELKNTPQQDAMTALQSGGGGTTETWLNPSDFDDPAQTGDLPDKLRASLESLANAEKRIAELESKLDEIHRNELAKTRFAELVEAGIEFSESRAEKVIAKLKGFTDEAFAEFKEDLIDVASAKQAKTDEAEAKKAAPKDDSDVDGKPEPDEDDKDAKDAKATASFEFEMPNAGGLNIETPKFSTNPFAKIMGIE